MAKFKVGDKVNDRAFGGPLYIVGLDYVNGSLHGYFVSNRPNGPRTMEKMEKDLVAANAKFSTGSEVLCYPGGDKTKKPYHGIVRKYIGNGTWDVFVKEKNTTLAADEKSIVSANAARAICTTNPIVANALKNGKIIACNGKFKVGDKVICKFKPFVGEPGKIVKVNETRGTYDVHPLYEPSTVMSNIPENEIAKNAVACNSVDADKLVAIYRKELNQGGDTIKVDGEETMPHGMKRLTIKLFGKMHEEDRETPDVRIEKAIRSGERASYTVVGRGNRITNDGSFETTVRVMTNPKA